MKFETEIEFGRRYKDKNSGFEGAATGVYFYEFGCTRVTLISMSGSGEVVEATFDEQALVEPVSQQRVKSVAPTGGPRTAPPRP